MLQLGTLHTYEVFLTNRQILSVYSVTTSEGEGFWSFILFAPGYQLWMFITFKLRSLPLFEIDLILAFNYNFLISFRTLKENYYIFSERKKINPVISPKSSKREGLNMRIFWEKGVRMFADLPESKWKLIIVCLLYFLNKKDKTSFLVILEGVPHLEYISYIEGGGWRSKD